MLKFAPWICAAVLWAPLALAAADAPSATSAGARVSLITDGVDATVAAAPSAFQLTALELGAGAGAALVAAPASLALGIWLGSLSANLLWAALPAVVAFVALPPVAVVFAQWALAQALLPGSARIQPAIWTTLGVQVLVLVGAILLGVHGANFGDAALLTLVELIVLPSSSLAVMRWTEKPGRNAASSAAAARTDDPGRPMASRASALTLASWSF